MVNKIFLWFFALGILWAVPGTVAGQEGGSGEDWAFDTAIYLWGASIGGESATGDNIDIDFNDLLDNMEFAFMTTIGAHRDKWSLIADFIYLDVKDDEQGSLTVPVGPSSFVVGTDSEVELSGWIVTPLVSYNVLQTERITINALAGARYLWLEADVEVKVGPSKVKFSDSGHVWDGIVGVRGQVNLSDKWYLPYHLDMGAGDTDFTWQVLCGIGYRLEKFDVNMGYRYLDWDFDDNDVFDDMNKKGLYGGAIFRF